MLQMISFKQILIYTQNGLLELMLDVGQLEFCIEVDIIHHQQHIKLWHHLI